MRYAAIAVVVILALAAMIVFYHEMGGRLNPSGGDTRGGECSPGAGECRRVAVIEASLGTPVPAFAVADFDKQKAWRIGSDHVTLPGCGTGGATGYYAYAHPAAEGPLQAFRVADGLDQSHSLGLQAGALTFQNVDHSVLVSSNLLECDRFEDQPVMVVK